MRKLLERKGVPFLLTLAFLTVASGGWLLYEILGFPGGGGAAAALETPDLPPPLVGPPSSPLPPSPSGKPQAVLLARRKSDQEEGQQESSRPSEGKGPVDKTPSDVSTIGSAEPTPKGPEKASPPSTQTHLSVSPANLAPQVSGKAPIAQGDQGTERPVVVPPPPAQPRQAPPAVASTSPAVASKSPKVPKAALSVGSPAPPPKKSSIPTSIPAPIAPSKAKKEATAVVGMPKGRFPAVEAIPSAIPPEWNWFQKPLRIVLFDGRVRIQVVDHDLAKASEVMPRVAFPEAKTQPQEKGEIREVAAATEPSLAGSPEAGQAESSEKPFARALQKMVRTKARRKAEAQRSQVVLPSHGGAREKVPRALEKLQKALMEMTTPVCDASANAERAPANSPESIRLVVDHVDTSSMGSEFSQPEVAEKVAPDAMKLPASAASRFGAGLGEVLRLQGWNRP